MAPETPKVRPVSVVPTTPSGPPWALLPEDTTRRWIPVVLLLIITGLFGYALSTFWAGAHSGVDQAGYMMTARLLVGEKNPEFPGTKPLSPPIVKELATNALPGAGPAPDVPRGGFLNTFSSWFHFAKPLGDVVRNRLSFVPESQFQFGSRMSIMTEPFHDPAPGEEPYRLYAKYPFGYSLLAAGARLLTGRWDAAYMVNPFCTVLAVFFSYFLFRTAVSRFAALMGAILLACNPLVLYYSNDANSHATTLCVVVIGFWGLLSWWKTGVWWRGFLGAFALGYACTIRYSEFLLVLPVTFAALANLRWNKKALWSSAGVMIGWAIPVVTLAMVCWIAFGAPWKTGYTYCKEDTGFAWKYFIGDNTEPTNRTGVGNWETFLQQMNRTGLFAVWPLALAGLMGMLGKSWRLGLTLGLWVIPSSMLYMFYYWAPQGETATNYLRFFVSTIPGFLFAALWLIDRALAAHPGEKWSSLIVATVFALLAGTWLVYYISPGDHAAGIISFVSAWSPAVFVAAAFLGLIGLMWRYERKAMPTHAGLALALAALVSITSGVNAYTFAPQLESMHYGQTNLRFTVDRVFANLPKGSLLFADESMCQQFDSIGGYQLFSTDVMEGTAFSRYKAAFDRKERTADAIDEPNPLQFERAAYYMSLLGHQKPNGVWTTRGPVELVNMQREIVDKALARGQRVAFLVSSPDAPDSTNPTPWDQNVPGFGGLKYVQLAWWRTQPPVTTESAVTARQAPTRGGGGGGGAGGGGKANGLVVNPGAMRGMGRGSSNWYLVEVAPIVVKNKPAVTQPSIGVGTKPAAPDPAPRDLPPPPPTGRVDFFGVGPGGNDAPPTTRPSPRN